MGWGVYDYPEPPPEKPMASCGSCNDTLTEEVFFVDGKVLCEDCFMEYVKDFTAVEIADAWGYEHTSLDTYEEGLEYGNT